MEVATKFRVVTRGGARIKHAFMPDGQIRRFVILQPKAWRDVLEKPRCTEIDPIDTRSPEAMAMTSADIWEMAERTAIGLLGELSAKVDEALQIKAQHELATQREQTERELGEMLVPVATRESVSGQLMFAGMRPGIAYCMEVMTEDGEARRIEGLDLARALDASGARVGEVITISPIATHNVEITSQHTGSHGDGSTRHRRTRLVFNIERRVRSEHSTA